MHCTKRTFGTTSEGDTISLFYLENSKGASIEVIDYGCRIRGIRVPGRDGVLRDVCLGYADLAGYESDGASLGAAVGRCANRIGGAKFTLNGVTYALEKNDGENHLHGGSKGFAFRPWNACSEDGRIIFTRNFQDGEDGYPGNLQMKIIYEWTEENRLSITYKAVSDKDTVINFTNHSYFNLEGPTSHSILDHTLVVNASRITENDGGCLPTGVIAPVEGTPFDFRQPKAIGQDIEMEHVQLKNGSGYDHNFVLDGQGLRKAAVLVSLNSGIRLTCHTDQPGIQIYTANFLGNCSGKYGEDFCPRNSVCLETQHFPNATNIPSFPSVVLKAGEAFRTTTLYDFDIVD